MLKGIPVSDGIGIGHVRIIKNKDVKFEDKAIPENEIDNELERFHDAVKVFCDRTEKMAKEMEKSVNPKEAEIIKGHIQMISDPFMISQIDDQIKTGVCAEKAAATTLDQFIEMFSSVDDELTQQRATDVSDIKKRLLRILLGIEEIDLGTLPPDTVIVTKELTPSMTTEIKKENIAGIITEKGGITSHSAILSRALEIPAVLSVPEITKILRDGDMVIIDGREGDVLPDPSDNDIRNYEKSKADFIKEKEYLDTFIGKDTVTADGYRKEVFCNIGNPKDGVTAVKKDGEGIGLFRTEFLFMDKDSAPSEEDQFNAYKKVAETLGGRTVIIRTLDVGGDKDIPYLDLKKEDNPFLGYRAVRYCLGHKDLYKVQLRAILKASAYGKIWIMIPMVTNVYEIRQVRGMVERIKTKFDAEGIPYDKDIKIGAMIETPAASLIADILAKECDFFSIGTNDLIQYTMAADRGNADVAYLYKPYFPAVLRSIKNIIECGKKEGLVVGMCGEGARDPMLIPLLIAFGLDEFSVSPTSVLAARSCISRWSMDEAREVADKALSLPTYIEVEEYLKSIVRK